MSNFYVLVSDGPSEERCRVVTPIAVYTSLSKAKAERARLNRIRAEEVATRAARLIGRHYYKLSASGATMTDAVHDVLSATTYAGYAVPVIRIVIVVGDAEVANGNDVFRAEQY